jgi:hypothetical protein
MGNQKVVTPPLNAREIIRDRIDWDLERLDDDDEGVAALEKERAKTKQRHKEKDNLKKRGDVNDDWLE